METLGLQDYNISYFILIIISVLITTMLILMMSIERIKKYRNDQIKLKELENLENTLHTIKSVLQQQNKQQQTILDHIIQCANHAIEKNSNAFGQSMQDLAAKLRTIFDSEYCAIGIVVGNTAKDCIIDFKKSHDKAKLKQQISELNKVQSAHTDNKDCKVCIALKSFSNRILNFNENEIDPNSSFYESYIKILGKVNNTTIIPIRENRNNYGYIQFINTKKAIKYPEFAPFMNAFTGLIQLIISRDRNEQERNNEKTKLIKAQNRAKDTDFYDRIQSKKENINELLDEIMNYFAKEFNAAVISFRIPIINVNQSNPLFYLRRCYVNPKVKGSDDLMKHYYLRRPIKKTTDLGGNDALKCRFVISKYGIISCAAGDTEYYKEHDLDLYEETFIMPILRDNILEQCDFKKKHNCDNEGYDVCPQKFKDYYGIFRLRISKHNLKNNGTEYTFNNDDVIQRLSYLSNQITLLFNTIVDKHETLSLETFQNELKNSSFVKIKDFDERCVNIIKKSVSANACSIYRLDNSNERLLLSATTVKEIHLNDSNENIDVISYKENCSIPIESDNNILAIAFKAKRPIYIYDIRNSQTHQSSFIENYSGGNHSGMAVPLMNKKGEPLGVVLLLGKENSRKNPSGFISTAYWEHDISHIEFIVNTLSRISESDNERMTFLSQLSHELLSPVTELVYDNDYIVNLAERDFNSLTKQQLITTIRNNMDTCMQLKYIICDTEFRYATSGKNMDYNIVKQDNPQEPLLDAIRLLEKEAHEKGLTIERNISKMPPMYFDKDRMMQVFINLLKNAIRYADNYSTIEIFYKQENNGFHEIRFVNRGIGVREEEKETIFELFYRGIDAKRKSDRGSGIGLYIIRDIMRAHGGDCYVRNLKDPTEFVITLPNIE